MRKIKVMVRERQRDMALTPAEITVEAELASGEWTDTCAASIMRHAAKTIGHPLGELVVDVEAPATERPLAKTDAQVASSESMSGVERKPPRSVAGGTA